MGIRIKVDLETGWRESENRRFGKALIISFIDESSGKCLFKYCPKLEEQKIWNKVFEMLEKYDTTLKDIRSDCDVINNFVFMDCFKPPKENDKEKKNPCV